MLLAHHPDLSVVYTSHTLCFLANFVETTQISKGYEDPQPRCQKEGVVEEGKFGRVLGIVALFTCVVADMYPKALRDTVPAAGPLCTRRKDKPGLGAPNSLKQYYD